MTTELFIENYRLDITADLSALLNFSLDDIKDFSSRSTAWSKTIVLPGTSNNNKLFGHIFQIGQANDYNAASPNVGYNFNASQSADCIIFQDNIQAFKGVLRLLQINIIKGRIEYEVSVFGKLAGLNVALSGGLLEDLDFSAYDHTYNDINIVNSWDNPGGTGIYYPLIDYGTYSTNKHDWDIRTFRPAVYAYEVIDKMFTAAGFRWSSDLFETPKFRGLVVPYNKKQLTKNLTTLFTASKSTPQTYNFPSGSVAIAFDVQNGTGFTPNGTNDVFTYNGTVTTNVIFDYEFQGTVVGFVFLTIWKNGEGTGTVVDAQTAFSNPFTISGTVSASFSPGDTIEFRFEKLAPSFTLNVAEWEATTQGGVPVPIVIGDTVNINDGLPKNIRQIDFLVSIVKMFNLYVYEDKLDTSLIYLKPYINFYQNAHNSALDWTYKLNRNKAIKLKPMSELTAKVYKFKYKSDSDYYNDLYRKRYNEGYGDRTYDSEFEFTEQVKEFEVIFSATPMVGYGGEDKVYSTIFKQSNGNEETVDSNIRLLQTKKITGVTTWQIKDGATVLNTLTRYGYAGHFDDPDVPNDDINFGATRELFFILATGNLSNNQFNVYWSGYMREITDKDSKLMSASFYLTPLDIVQLDFSKLIYVDGGLFRLNSIKDYNASKPADCVVELLKVNSVNYTEASDPESPPEGNFLLWNDGNTLDWDDLPDNELLYRGTESAYLNWTFDYSAALTAYLRIYKNAALIVEVFNADQTGSLSFNAGDVIKVDVIASPHGIKKVLTVDSDIDGNLYTGASSTANKSHTWTVLEGRTYTVFGQTTL